MFKNTIIHFYLTIKIYYHTLYFAIAKKDVYLHAI